MLERGPGGARRPARRPRDGPRRARAGARGRARDPAVRARRRPPARATRSTSRSAATVVVAAPGGRVVDGDWPASALTVELAARRAAPAGGGRAARAARRAAARLPRRQGLRPLLRGPRGRVHPDHRRRGPPVLGLPRLPRPQARRRDRARPGPAGDAHADGHGVPDGRPALEVLRRRHGPAVPGGAGHRRAPRLLRAGLHRALLRGPRLPRPRQLHGELQPPARRLRDRAQEGLGGAELLLQHVVRPRPRAALRRAVVAPRRLRAAARAVGPRLRLLGLPRRHRPGQRLGGHRRPRPRLLAGEPLLDGHRPPRHPGGRPADDQGDGLPPALVAR